MAGLVDKLKERANNIVDGLKQQYGKAQLGEVWPQTTYSPLALYEPYYKTRGWLPPTSILVDENNMSSKYPNYIYTDWRGFNIVEGTDGRSTMANIGDRIPLDGRSKFGEPSSIGKENGVPLSTREHYLIFNDNSTDYFKHGIQVIDNINTVQTINYDSPHSNKDFRYKNKDGNINIDTPYEHNDPIIYGFDIVIDAVSSPLLNGSIIDFIANYSNVSEIAALRDVYENFKTQFQKFFKINISELNITDSDKLIFSNLGGKFAPQNFPKYHVNDSKTYMNYYLKKITGLDNLVERNTPNSKKFLNKYNDDIISLAFSEDVSMSVGTLAHLYKLLYWSKPNGKGLIPENLLRFNCDIIVSEVRNFKRVTSIIEESETDGNGISKRTTNEIRDNVSRYIYSLKECQFYFNSLPHPSEVDLNNISVYGEGGYSIQFDYKYVTHKMERFTPKGYVGYDSGSIWKVSNDRINGNDSVEFPKFYSEDSKLKFENIGTDLGKIDTMNVPNRMQIINDNPDPLVRAKLMDKITDRVLNTATNILQTKVNSMTGLLNKSLNKITNSIGITGVMPPRNVYDKPLRGDQRLFYDVRNELVNFLGDSLGSALNGNFTKKTF